MRGRKKRKQTKTKTREDNEEEKWREGESYAGCDRNNTNRKLVSTAEETTSLHLVTTFISHSFLHPLSLSFCLLQNLHNFPFAYFKDNKPGQRQRSSYWTLKIYNFNQKSHKKKTIINKRKNTINVSMLQCVLFLFVIEGFRHFGKFWGILMLLSSREREILKAFAKLESRLEEGGNC